MIALKDIYEITKKKMPVRNLLSSPIEFKHLNEKGLDNLIEDKYIYRPQLPLAGFYENFIFNRIQLFGNTEMQYLNSLSEDILTERISRLGSYKIPCIITSNEHKLSKSLIDILDRNNIAILSTDLETAKLTSLITEYLDDYFAVQATVHGSFLDVYGVGILFVGKSGIGKSEIALDLVERGHRLVADDIVMLTKNRESTLMGTGTNLVQHFMEIRGLGIIDVRQMFGIRSIRFQKRLEIVVELEDWTEKGEYTRTGLEEVKTPILGVGITSLVLPIFPGKNITVIAETIALNYLLKTYGYNASKVFSDKLSQQIKLNQMSGKDGSDRLIEYFQGDNE
ncbi:MAG: HPr(Ser) kinase/phosphatase [Candidatus Kapaibacteriales bacterium]